MVVAAALDSRAVVALDVAGATIVDQSGGRLRFHRRPFPGSVNPVAGSAPLWRVGERAK